MTGGDKGVVVVNMYLCGTDVSNCDGMFDYFQTKATPTLLKTPHGTVGIAHL